MAQCIYSNGSPAQQLLLQVGARGMTVRHLVELLDKLRLDTILIDLVEYQHVRILTQPKEAVTVYEGDQIVLSVEANGIPYPRFLWYRSETPITGATDSMLIINNARSDQSGVYTCLVYNNSEKGEFTNYSTVSVLPKPQKETKEPFTENGLPYPVPGKTEPVYTLPVIIREPDPTSTPLGSTFCLICDARGHLPLTYTWLLNTRPVYQCQTGYYKVDQADSSHDGIYQCEVNNQFGMVRSRAVPVCVTAPVWPMFDPMPLVPEITEHPKSCHVQLGGHAIFRCSAQGSGHLRFQWFKDCDSIQGANDCEFKVYNVNNRAAEGVYMCLISNDHGQRITKGAVLQVRDIPSFRHFFATDKLALLIGNYDYRSQQPLRAPQTDIQNLSNIFQEVLGFKVVSLLNLTLVEMLSAVEEFCELIDSGVYCVFYFCGHGFEENNQCYILPNDVPVDYKTEECLSADLVLGKMQQKRPKVCCMILDICRKPSENPSQGPNAPLMKRSPVEDGNTIVCYATSCGLAAYESRPESKGILVTHLEKLLREPISIEEIFRKVREAVGNDIRVNRNHRTRQIPEVRSNLIEVDRSFHDTVQTSGHTRACNARQLAWENAHLKPPVQMVQLSPQQLGVNVMLSFQHEFSNVLSVFVKVTERGDLPYCVAWIHKLPSSVSMMKKPTCVSDGGTDVSVTKNVIIDIQKLKDNLRVGLAMRYRLPGSGPHDYIISKEDTEVDLQLPLVAGLQLWRPRPQVSGHRHAVEQTEEETH